MLAPKVRTLREAPIGQFLTVHANVFHLDDHFIGSKNNWVANPTDGPGSSSSTKLPQASTIGLAGPPLPTVLNPAMKRSSFTQFYPTIADRKVKDLAIALGHVLDLTCASIGLPKFKAPSIRFQRDSVDNMCEKVARKVFMDSQAGR